MENNKKSTFILILPIAILLLASIGFVFIHNQNTKTNNEIVIMVNGKRYMYENSTYPSLKDEKTFTIQTELGFNTIQIQDNSVSVIDSDCRDEVCIHTGQLNRQTDTDMIVCAPHRLCIYLK